MLSVDHLGNPLVHLQRYRVYLIEQGHRVRPLVATWNADLGTFDQGRYTTDIGEEIFGPEVAVKI